MQKKKKFDKKNHVLGCLKHQIVDLWTFKRFPLDLNCLTNNKGILDTCNLNHC